MMMGIIGGDRLIFSPMSLAPIAWWDLTDLSTLGQNTDGTGAVSTDGTTVKYVRDKSGNGRHLTSSVGCIYRAGGGTPYLEFNGTNQYLQTSTAFTPAQPVVRVSTLQTPSSMGSGTQHLFGGVGANTGVLYPSAPTTASIYSGSVLTGPTIATSTPYCFTERHNGASSRVATNNNAYFSGNAGTYAFAGVNVANDFTLTRFAAIRFYGAAMYNYDVADSDIAKLRTYFGNLAGLSL